MPADLLLPVERTRKLLEEVLSSAEEIPMLPHNLDLEARQHISRAITCYLNAQQIITAGRVMVKEERYSTGLASALHAAMQ
jgi:hypothetical protein